LTIRTGTVVHLYGEHLESAMTDMQRLAEARLEDSPDCRHKRGASCQKHHVDLTSANTARVNQRIHTGLDQKQLFGDPLLELRPPHQCVQMY